MATLPSAVSPLTLTDVAIMFTVAYSISAFRLQPFSVKTSGVARGGATGAMPPPKLLLNVFFLQQIDVVTFFDFEISQNLAEVR